MSTSEPTWEAFEEHGYLTTRSNLPETVFAFPRQRKEPMTDAQHVRNAVARFDQVLDVSDEDRALAFVNIEKAAKYYGVNLSETNWRELGRHPNRHRLGPAAAGVRTRTRHR
ncbi:MAG: DUF6582 domain-containing protein [Actinomycetota bacterium]